MEGETLDQRIEKGPVTLQDVLDIARQIAEGLQAAHAKGIVHRDIKPGNVLITADGRVKILDFGLALLTEGSKLTKLDTTVGTVAYMSPEQAQGGEVDHRTDIWALGCLLHEMVAGQRPFQGHYDQAIVYAVINEEPEPLSALRTGVPAALENVVAKCMRKEASERYQHADDLIADLRVLEKQLEDGSGTLSRQRRQPAAAAKSKPVGVALREMAAWCLATVGLASTLWLMQSRVPTPTEVRHYTVVPGGYIRAAKVSPDGRRIAYRGIYGSSLYVWDLATNSRQELSGALRASRDIYGTHTHTP